LNAAVIDSAAVTSAQSNGWKGIIVNGAVRNANAIKNAQIGVKAIGTHPSKGQQSIGQTGASFQFGGVTFSPGNWVYTDKDGIVVSQTSLSSEMNNAVTPTYGTNTYSTQNNYSGTNSLSAQNNNAYNGVNAYTQNNNAYNGVNTQGNAYSATNSYGTQNNAYGGMKSQGTYGNVPNSVGNTNDLPAGQYSKYGGLPANNYNQGGLANQTQKNYLKTPSSAYTYTSDKQKKAKKRKLISLVILLFAVVWLCLGD